MIIFRGSGVTDGAARLDDNLQRFRVTDGHMLAIQVFRCMLSSTYFCLTFSQKRDCLVFFSPSRMLLASHSLSTSVNKRLCYGLWYGALCKLEKCWALLSRILM
jgi:hypothetical protein